MTKAKTALGLAAAAVAAVGIAAAIRGRTERRPNPAAEPAQVAVEVRPSPGRADSARPGAGNARRERLFELLRESRRAKGDRTRPAEGSLAISNEILELLRQVPIPELMKWVEEPGDPEGRADLLMFLVAIEGYGGITAQILESTPASEPVTEPLGELILKLATREAESDTLRTAALLLVHLAPVLQAEEALYRVNDERLSSGLRSGHLDAVTRLLERRARDSSGKLVERTIQTAPNAWWTTFAPAASNRFVTWAGQLAVGLAADPSEDVRAGAAEIVGAIPESFSTLADWFSREDSLRVKEAILDAAWMASFQEGLSFRTDRPGHVEAIVRLFVAGLALDTRSDLKAELVKSLSNPRYRADHGAQISAGLTALAQTGEEDVEVRVAAIEGLAEGGYVQAAPALRALMSSSSDPDVKQAVLRALKTLGQR